MKVGSRGRGGDDYSRDVLLRCDDAVQSVLCAPPTPCVVGACTATSAAAAAPLQTANPSLLPLAHHSGAPGVSSTRHSAYRRRSTLSTPPPPPGCLSTPLFCAMILRLLWRRPCRVSAALRCPLSLRRGFTSGPVGSGEEEAGGADLVSAANAAPSEWSGERCSGG